MLAASVSHIVQASSELTKQLVSSKQPTADSFDVKLNQSINQLRRNFIKPSLPVQYARLADIANDLSEHLFRDSIANSLESLKKENQMKALLRKGQDLLGKRKYYFPQQSSNFEASSKILRRTQDQGHYVRRPEQSQNYNNKYNNYNRQHSSTKKDAYHRSSSWKPKKH